MRARGNKALIALRAARAHLAEAAPAEAARRHCRKCGCTDDRACEGGCYWVENDLCSRCAEEGV